MYLGMFNNKKLNDVSVDGNIGLSVVCVGGGGGEGYLKFKYPQLTTVLLVWKIIANSARLECWPGYLDRTQGPRQQKAGDLS